MKIMNIGSKTFEMVDIEDKDLRNRNFAGNERKDRNTGRTLNSAGNRNFLLMLDEMSAEQLKDLGCDVKYFPARDENDIARPFIQVNISYFKKPVEVHYISGNVDTLLGEDRLYMLDSVDFKSLGLLIELGNKRHQDGSWYKALYAQQIWAEVTPSYFAQRYSYLNQPEEEPPF